MKVAAESLSFQCESIWVGFAGAGNADTVVGELEMGAGELDLGHMTTHAAVIRERAGLRDC